MSFFKWFDVRRKVRELEDAMVLLVEDQDIMQDQIRVLAQSVGGMKGSFNRWKKSSDSVVGVPHVLDDVIPSDDLEMSEEEFTATHGCSAKQFADAKIRSGAWK